MLLSRRVFTIFFPFFCFFLFRPQLTDLGGSCIVPDNCPCAIGTERMLMKESANETKQLRILSLQSDVFMLGMGVDVVYYVCRLVWVGTSAVLTNNTTHDTYYRHAFCVVWWT